MAPTATTDTLNGIKEHRFGARLLPHVVDELAVTDPERNFAIYQITANAKDGFRYVSMRELAGAVNTAAWWIKETLGQSTNFETIAYVGPSDIRYAIILLAAIKCRFKVGCQNRCYLYAD